MLFYERPEGVPVQAVNHGSFADGRHCPRSWKATKRTGGTRFGHTKSIVGIVVVFGVEQSTLSYYPMARRFGGTNVRTGRARTLAQMTLESVKSEMAKKAGGIKSAKLVICFDKLN